MVARVAVWLLAILYLAVAEEESLFDDNDAPAADWQEGESLFDDPPPGGDWKEGESLVDDIPASPDEITFGTGSSLSLTPDITFDDNGNVKEGGSSDPDIAFWHIAEFNGERIIEPTEGSDMLLAAIEKGDSYVVKFAPPDLSKVQCTEKVEQLSVVLEAGWHDMPEEMMSKALATLAEEGVTNTKQLGELYEKDYDAIKIPAIIKSRLRISREEAQRQAETASKKVEMDSPEVQEELAAFMAARGKSTHEPSANGTQAEHIQVAETTDAPVAEETEEDGTFKSLVWAIMNCPTCKGKETIGCLRSCRYGEDEMGRPKTAGTWSDCLNQCISNRWIRATFYVLLPKS